MPSEPIGVCCRVVVVFLGAASVFHHDAQVLMAGKGMVVRIPYPGATSLATTKRRSSATSYQVTSAAVSSGLRVNNVNALGQAAIDKAMLEHVRRQQLDDAEHSERRLSTDGLHPATKCIEGQSFSIVSSRSPKFDGCYTESGLGRVPRMTGEYTYALSDGTPNDINKNITTAVVALSIPGLQDTRLHWMLGSSLADHPSTCVSVLHADHFHHPADGPWICDFSGNGTDVQISPNAMEFSVSCGCSGSRTKFDRNAALAKERNMERYKSAGTHYHPQYNSSDGVDIRLFLFFMTAIIGLFVRIDNIRRNNRIRRLRALIRARAAETGVELPERIAESVPLRSDEPQVADVEQ